MKGTLLLDLGPNQMVLARQQGEELEVLQRVSPGWRNQPGRSASEVLSALRNPGLAGSRVVVGLPQPLVDLRCETLPGQIPEKEAARAIINRIQPGGDQQHWPSRVIMKTLGGSREAILARLDNAPLQALMDTLAHQGLEVVALRPRSLGLWPALSSEAVWLHLEPGAGHLAGLAGGQVVHFEGIPEAVEASLNFALGRSYLQPDHPLTPRGEAWNPIRRHAALQEPLAQLQQRAEGLRQSLESRFGTAPTRLYFTGAPAFWPEARLLLGLGPWEVCRPEIPGLKIAPLVLAQYTHLVGLCLPVPLEWTPGTVHPPLVAGSARWVRLAGACLTLVLGLASGGLAWQDYRQQQTLLMLQAQWEQLQPFALEEAQLNQQLAALGKTLEVRDALFAQRIDWPQHLARLLDQIPSRGIRLTSLQLRPGIPQPDLYPRAQTPRLVLELTGVADQLSQLERLLRQLDSPPHLAVSLQHSQRQNSGSGWEFTLTVAYLAQETGP